MRFAAGQCGEPAHHHQDLLDLRARRGGAGHPPAPDPGGEEVVLHPDAPNNYNPIFEDDYVRLAVRALEVARDPVVVNFAGSETVSAEDYCAYLGELVPPVRIRYDRRPLAALARRDPDARRPRPDRRCRGGTACAASPRPSADAAAGLAPGRTRLSADTL